MERYLECPVTQDEKTKGQFIPMKTIFRSWIHKVAVVTTGLIHQRIFVYNGVKICSTYLERLKNKNHMTCP